MSAISRTSLAGRDCDDQVIRRVIVDRLEIQAVLGAEDVQSEPACALVAVNEGVIGHDGVQQSGVPCLA
ncbi:hypothetical protein ACIBQX_09360 [Nonomuraea sp. NPDC049714]|uniref:hypothetical protein n=1 Tax=Nonomuraea sp. NPDC049714 TaxID=3364357 RepID=UPI003799C23C